MGICDKQTFETLFHQWCAPAQRFLISRGADQVECVDFVQEAFMRMWQKCKDLSKEQAKSFIMTTSYRLMIDAFRKKQTRNKYTLSLSPHVDVEDGQYQAELNEFKEQLEAAIASMPELSREVFMLYRFEGMKYKEIATQLDITVKAVEKRMSKGLKHLRTLKIPKFN